MPSRSYPVWLLALSILFIIDRLTKELARLLPAAGKGLVYFGYWPNSGLGFGLETSPGLVAIIIPAALTLIGLLAIQAVRQNQFLWLVGSSLLLAGGLSNYFDRLVYGGVSDFIHLWRLPVFNLADLYLLAGLTMALIVTYRERYVS